MFFFAFFELCFSLKFSEFCSNSGNRKDIEIDAFDIPTAQCSEEVLSGLTVRTKYSAILEYSDSYRTLRVPAGMALHVSNVRSGDILQKIDVDGGALHLYADGDIDTLSGPLRINDDGSHLYVHSSSFRVSTNRKIRIVHTNDIHCSLSEAPESTTIGYPKLVTFIKEQRARAKKEGYGVLALDAGDFISGMYVCNMRNGTAGIDAVINAEYDAVTVGNHFWDFGYSNAVAHKARLDSANIDFICANIDDKNAETPMVFPSYTIKEVGGLRVGIFALTTPLTKETTNPDNVKNVNFDKDIVGISQKMVNELRNKMFCDVVVLLSHLGFNSSDYASNVIAEAFNGIDVIIDGHSHTVLENGYNQLNNDYKTLIAQTGANLKNIGVVDILIDSETNKITGKKAVLLNYTDTIDIVGDVDAQKLLDESYKKVENISNEEVGHSYVNLNNDQTELRLTGNSPLGNYVSSAILEYARVETKVDFDMIIVNGGLIRAPILKGKVTYGDLFSILPFGNSLVGFKLTGANIRKILMYGTNKYKISNNGHLPLFSGLKIKVNLNAEPEDDDRILDMALVDNEGNEIKKVLDDQYYMVLTDDFIAQGGDGYTMYLDYQEQKLSNYKSLVDYLKMYIKRNGYIYGNETNMNYVRYTDNANEQLRALKSSYRKPLYDNEKAVVIDGTFNALEYGYTDDFYSSTINANGYLANDIDELRKFVGNTSMAYFCSDVFCNAASIDKIKYGYDVSEEFRDVPISSKCGFFKKYNKDFKCVTNAPVTVLFVISIIFVVLIVVLIIIVAINRKGGYVDISGTANGV